MLTGLNTSSSSSSLRRREQQQGLTGARRADELEEVHAELPLAEEIGPWWLVAWRTAGAPRYGAPGARVECTCVNDERTDERRTTDR